MARANQSGHSGRKTTDDLAALQALAESVRGWATPREIHKALAGQLDLFSVGVRREEMPKAERKDRSHGQGFLFDDQD